MAESSKSLSGKIPLQVKDVTILCVATLKSIPLARANEGFLIPSNILVDKLIPQENDRIFPKIYVTHELIKNGQLEFVSVDLFPNYVGHIFEIVENNIKQLLLVGFPNDLGLSVGGSLPFLLYIPPSPQHSPAVHKKLYPRLYADTPPQNIPYFYKDMSKYPFSWDWLYFQFFTNMFKLSYQLRKAGKPYVFVVPLIKSFSEGLGILNSGVMLERCLLGIQEFYIHEKFKEQEGHLIDRKLKHIAIASFSIGNSILGNFIMQNRENPFFRDAIKDFIILDPPFGNPNNRSSIIDAISSIMRIDKNKSIFLYTQEAYYIHQVIQKILGRKGNSIDIKRNRVFSNTKEQNVFFAYLESSLFLKHLQDPVLKDVHNTFPNLFINHAAQKTRLRFRSFNGQLSPEMSFLDWVPTASGSQ